MANPTLVKQIMRAEELHLARQMAVLRADPACQHYAAHDIAGSLTLATEAKYGRKLNHTVGFGMDGPVSAAQLTAIEATYRANGLPPELDMCSHADASAFALLEAASFVPTGTIDTFALDLRTFDPETAAATAAAKEESIATATTTTAPAEDDLLSPSITIAETTDATAFRRASVEGFQSGGRSAELLGQLANVAAQRADTTLFFALRGNPSNSDTAAAIIGSAGLARIEVDGVRFANLYIDSTLPAARGHGVHARLISARLAAAAGKRFGCDWAVASARAGSGSARNLVRAGLRWVFTTVTYTKQVA